MWFNDLPFDNEMPVYNYKSGILEIKGNFRPTDAYISFAPILDKLKDYSQHSNDLIIKFSIDYLNTSSFRFLKQMIYILNLMQEKGGKVETYWFFDEYDERIEEQGEDLKYISEFKFKLTKK